MYRYLAGAVALVAASVPGLVLPPGAHADDPLADIRSAVNGARAGTPCQALRYNFDLEHGAQVAAANERSHISWNTNGYGYVGEIQVAIGNGDPASAARQNAIRGSSGLVDDCRFADFGVGFQRDDVIENDAVVIFFGDPPDPPAPAPPPKPAAPPPPPPVQCPEGSPTPTVPVGQQCAPIPDVTNAIQASFGDPGLTKLTFNVTNTSKIEATCNYTATSDSINPLVPKKTTRQFNVPANGSHTETFDGAPTLSTYNAVLSCKDASGKQKAELGHVETSVTW